MSVEFANVNETKGFWLFGENGILWPPVPARSNQGDKMAQLLKSVYDVDTIELVVLDDTIHFYCDEQGRISGKHQANVAFGRQLFGPLLFAGENQGDGKNDDDDGAGDDGSDAPLEWSTLLAALSRTHHSCGWPLLRSEKIKKPQRDLIASKTLARDLIPDNVWQALWPPAAAAAAVATETVNTVAGEAGSTSGASSPKRKAEAEEEDAKKKQKKEGEEEKEKEHVCASTASSHVVAPTFCEEKRAAVDSDAETEGDEANETNKTTESATTATPSCDAWFHAPTLWNGKPLPITAGRVEADDRTINRYKCGALVRRGRIVQYPKGAPIDTVSFTILTVEGSVQRPMAIAHFAQDGTLVRAQVNCFAMGILPDDGSYFEEFAEELREDKKESESDDSSLKFARL